MIPKKLEAIIDALTDSLEVVSHNSIETEYVLILRQKYEQHYKKITGRYYGIRRNQEHKFIIVNNKYRRKNNLNSTEVKKHGL
jgi:hypothetical protein